jgi:uncharacterized protein (DUF302 family)
LESNARNKPMVNLRDNKMINYGFTKEIEASLEEAITKVTNELKKEGFGILTQIDVAEKFKEKLGIDFEKYIILGACNPPSAHEAILVEENIGLMLPCNVAIYKRRNKTVVSIIKPTVAMKMIGNSELEHIASAIEKKLKKVFDAII